MDTDKKDPTVIYDMKAHVRLKCVLEAFTLYRKHMCRLELVAKQYQCNRCKGCVAECSCILCHLCNRPLNTGCACDHRRGPAFCDDEDMADFA